MFEDVSTSPVYLDFAATTPVSHRVAEVVSHYMTVEFGNAGSRTHEWGLRAKRAVAEAREYLAATMNASPEELIFTSGATESNNLAILGLAEYGRETGRTHLVTSATEHKAVLEPMEQLAKQGFDVDFVRPGPSGRFTVEEIMRHVRDDTLLVSLMHVNNETGVMQPTAELAEVLVHTKSYFHVDAAQGFAKYPEALRSPIDLVSISGHKIGAPKGVGGLLIRRRKWSLPPLRPLVFGGGQERGLRPGTLPVALVMGLLEATRQFELIRGDWHRRVLQAREAWIAELAARGARIHCLGEPCAPHILNFYWPGHDSESLILQWRGDVAVSSGSACTSNSYTSSHVLAAMGMSEEESAGSLRVSFSGESDDPPRLPFG